MCQAEKSHVGFGFKHISLILCGFKGLSLVLFGFETLSHVVFGFKTISHVVLVFKALRRANARLSFLGYFWPYPWPGADF